MKLLDAFLVHAAARPGHAALITPQGRTVTYSELERLSSVRAASFSKAGIGKGDAVLVARGVSPGLYAALLALFRLGAVAMFPEPAAGIPGLRAAVKAAKPKAMVGGPLARGLRPFIAELSSLRLLQEPSAGPTMDGRTPTGDADLALITFTSGSTGRPKGIVRSVGLLELQHALLENLRQTGPDDVDLISLPVFILSNLAEGATSVIPAGNLRRPAKLDGAQLRRQIHAHGVRRIVAPPAVCARIADGGRNLPFSAVFTGGGPVFPNLLRDLRAAAPAAAIHAVYGSTEAEPIAHLSIEDIAEADWESMASGAGLLAGRPIPEIEVEIVDGEIQVAGPHVNRGYLDAADNASTKVERKGRLWHRTGDAGRIDGSGRLWLLGRRNAVAGDLFPFAVETAALSWPGVRQAALLAEGQGGRLFLAGEALDLPDLQRRALRLGQLIVVRAASIPMDRRHNSKVDYSRLR